MRFAFLKQAILENRGPKNLYAKIFLSEFAWFFFYELFLSLSFPVDLVKKSTVTWPKDLTSWFCLGLADKDTGDYLMIIKEIQVTLLCH